MTQAGWRLIILSRMEMTPERWEYTLAYSREVFGHEDEFLAALMQEARQSGLPDIAVSADVGRMLKLLASTTRGRLALEVGTLGGYSTIWIARGLAPPPRGRIITIESEDLHADFAQRQFERAGLADRIELRRGTALTVLPRLARELGPASVDFVFLDAVKTEYPDYWGIVRPMIAEGGLIVADNAFGSGHWWIDSVGDPSREAADRFNRLVASDPQFEAFASPLRQGVLVGRRMQREGGSESP